MNSKVNIKTKNDYFEIIKIKIWSIYVCILMNPHNKNECSFVEITQILIGIININKKFSLSSFYLEIISIVHKNFKEKI